MRRPARPGFWLVAKRETRWLLGDRAALVLIFGVPLFAFVVLSAVFSHPVIRGLGVVAVDEDRSETSRAFVQQVSASPGLKPCRARHQSLGSGERYSVGGGNRGRVHPAQLRA
jgi:ABC-2 type transport system permease protein